MIYRTLLLIVVSWTLTLAAVVPTRIGDPGSKPDTTRFDPAYPEMAGYAAAGVTGGIPSVERVVASIGPDADFVATIRGLGKAQVSPDNPGVLLLAAGEYPIKHSIDIPAGLVVRGAGKDQTALVSELNEKKATHGVMEAHAIFLKTRSALEDLTVCNRHVRAMDPTTYDGKYENPGAPGNGLVMIQGRSKDCWIDRCDLTHAGSNPLSINGSNITIRDTLIDRAYNKGGKGHGYLEVGNAHHILFYNCTITNIRHISIMWKSSFIVILNCSLNIDINYHDGLPTKCLVEQTTIKRRKKHHWSPISYGWEPWQRVGPGPRCLLWNNTFDGNGGGKDQVWVLRDTTPGYANMATKKPMLLKAGGPPKHGTLYAVTGEHIPYERVAKGRCMANLAKAQEAKDHRDTLHFAALAQSLFAPDSPEHASAATAIAGVEAAAQAALDKLGAKAKGSKLADFVRRWPPTKARTAAQDRLAGLAKADWDKIAKGGKEPLASKTRKFVDAWHGLTDISYAQTVYDSQAKVEYDRAKDRLDKSKEAASFIDRWPHAAVTAQAHERWVAALKKDLIGLETDVGKMKARQKAAALKPFLGTPVEAEARKLLE